MKKNRIKTGEKRKVRQPFHVDRLPPAVHQEILRLRNERNTSWEQIEALSAEKIKDGGFVNWDELPTSTLELFPNLRIPKSNLQRWYDVRVEQIQADVLRSAEQARVIAEQFAQANLMNSNEAVTNAARDLIMGMLGNSTAERTRLSAIKGLIALSETLQAARANDIRERKVSIEERKIAELEKEAALRRQKLEREAENASKKLKKGKLTEADLSQLVERTFGFKPKQHSAA